MGIKLRELEQSIITRLDNIQSSLDLLNAKQRRKKSESIKPIIDINQYRDIKDKWNAFCDTYSHIGISKVQVIDTRLKGMKARLKCKDFDFDLILKIIPLSSFLLGRKIDFRINFDYIFKSDLNWPGILEGIHVDEHHRRKFHIIVDEHHKKNSDTNLNDILSKIAGIGKSI